MTKEEKMKIKEEKDKERFELLLKMNGSTYYTEDKIVKCCICGKKFSVPNNYDPPINDPLLGQSYMCKSCGKIAKEKSHERFSKMFKEYHFDWLPVKFLRKWARDAVLKRNGLL